ncbi:WhiB family transcriptional regulator [Nocardia abscessus]|uniref:WhiB family transcriptional regulator n=1 Tax=Nocardia abscessus TaxID=120957 RepID=UPI0024563F31|nr:WhiB family transcriptional regulator [Nocardia abscessus]
MEEPIPACAGAPNPELWWSGIKDEIDDARAVCIGCPVRVRCAEIAVRRNERAGVWGGYDFSSVKQFRAAEKLAGIKARRRIRRKKDERDCTGCGTQFTTQNDDEQCVMCRQGMVDAGPVRERVLVLRKTMTYAEITSRSRVSASSLTDLIQGRSKHVTAITAARIFDLPVPTSNAA